MVCDVILTLKFSEPTCIHVCMCVCAAQGLYNEKNHQIKCQSSLSPQKLSATQSRSDNEYPAS